MKRDPNDYPRDHKPGTHWSTDKGWQIMDIIPPTAISPQLRDLISGMIAGALVEARRLGAREGDVPGPKIHDATIAHAIDSHFEHAQTFIRAHVQVAYLREFLQHIRDFDRAHPGCHFEIAADAPDKPLAEMVEMLRVDPALSFSKIFTREET